MASKNKKVSQLEHDYRLPSSSSFLTSDFGVKESSHDISLSASVGDRKGPVLLEDNFAREKVISISIEIAENAQPLSENRL